MSHMLDDDVVLDGGMTIRNRNARHEQLGGTITAGEGGGNMRDVSFARQMDGAQLMAQTQVLVKRPSSVVVGVFNRNNNSIEPHVGYIESVPNSQFFKFRYSQSNQLYGNYGVGWKPDDGNASTFDITDDVGSTIKWIVAGTVWLDEHHAERAKKMNAKIVTMQSTIDDLKRGNHGSQQQQSNGNAVRDLVSANAAIHQLKAQLQSANDDISRFQYELDKANNELYNLNDRRAMIGNSNGNGNGNNNGFNGNGNGNGHGASDYTRDIMQYCRATMDEVFVVEDVMSFDKQQYLFVDKMSFEVRLSAIVQHYAPSVLKQDPASAHQRGTVVMFKHWANIARVVAKEFDPDSWTTTHVCLLGNRILLTLMHQQNKINPANYEKQELLVAKTQNGDKNTDPDQIRHTMYVAAAAATASGGGGGNGNRSNNNNGNRGGGYNRGNNRGGGRGYGGGGNDRWSNGNNSYNNNNGGNNSSSAPQQQGGGQAGNTAGAQQRTQRGQ
jgi:hypothetical protein